ncbi:helix-turn-helix transcriptional regulator [Fulvivirgaceae bacterium PWU5]|uniref:Helix-turn-helix transcriptional regulator n=1 Tax=Dawidia cretensis TaxID=2782350 RepID=A0AAP2DVA7_9BACT|nr:helix-turn-helix domain-containing protein [Dawidia cretensis]MBT1708083.1 helix-turn-helix transcriptional regulator [Dawidia cretensis]
MPYRVDLFAVFILMGIVQALFLSFFFLTRENRKMPANLYHGILLLTMAACLLEILLLYTGYIQHMLHLVDFSEAPAFLIGPALYLMVVSLIHGTPGKRPYLHFIFPVVYLLLQLPFLLQPENEKYNAYIFSYHPGLPYREMHHAFDPRPFWVTDNHSATLLISLFLYGILVVVEVVKAFRQKRESLLHTQNPVLRKVRAGILHLALVFGIILLVKLIYRADTGDHLLAAFLSLTVYFTSFNIIRQSGFFSQVGLAEAPRYKNSSVTPAAQRELLEKLTRLMAEEKPFLNSNFSLPGLAQALHASVHAVSQAINEGLGKSFSELTAEYRIEEARRLLKDMPHIKVEEIGLQVGYNSKSAFNIAFKKLTQRTPSEYRGQ